MTPVIELTQICRTYDRGSAGVRALRGVNLCVTEGDYVGIVGASGSGKSTLMNVIGLLDRQTSGTYRLNGSPVENLNDGQLSSLRNEHIGFVFQSFHLLSRMTALENVMLPLGYRMLGRKQTREMAIEALRMVGLADRQDHRPSELSGGECQRVAIARALVGQPRLILADEPTGNLDSETTGEIIQLLEQLVARGNTLLIVTHEEEVARRCSRVVRMRDGQVAADHRN